MGSVHQDQRTGRWYVSRYWDGTRYRIFKYNGEYMFTRRTALKLLHKIQAEIDDGMFVPKSYLPDSPLAIKQYADEWLTLCTVCSATKKAYRSAMSHVIYYMGDEDIRHITHAKLLKLQQALEQKGLGEKARYNILGTLRTMLRFAYKNEDIARVPPFPKLSVRLPERIDYITLAQQTEIVQYIPEEHRGIFLMAMEYGLRNGEVRALQWDAVEDGSLIIKRSLSDYQLRETTKTGENRSYGLTDRAKEILADAKRRNPFGTYIFTRDGHPYSNKVMNKLWRDACEKAGVKIKLNNGCRHSLGCQLFDEGYSIDLIQDTLGHKSPAMTRRYAKRAQSQITDALQNRGRVIKFQREAK